MALPSQAQSRPVRQFYLYFPAPAPRGPQGQGNEPPWLGHAALAALIPLLKTTDRQLLPAAKLRDSQPTLRKPLADRAPLGRAAPYFPVGCDSHVFLLYI